MHSCPGLTIERCAFFRTSGLHCPEVAKEKASYMCGQTEICLNPSCRFLPYGLEQMIYYPRAEVSVVADGAGN